MPLKTTRLTILIIEILLLAIPVWTELIFPRTNPYVCVTLVILIIYSMAVVNRGKHKAMKLIESEKSLVGRQLKISRVELGSWHVSQATEARIEWREGGKAAMMHHKVQAF